MTESIRDIFDYLKANARRYEAGAAVDWIKTHAATMGLAQPPELIHLDHSLPMAAGGFALHANGTATPRVWLTQGIIDKVFTNTNLEISVPDGLKAILAHEMSHVKDGLEHRQYRALPIFAMPVLGLIGYEIYKQAHARHEAAPSTPLKSHIDGVVAEHRKALPGGYEDWLQGHRQDSIEWGRKFAIAGAGLAAGVAISRGIALDAEFRADRAAMEALGGNPEPFLKALESIGNAIDTTVAPKLERWRKELGSRSIADNMREVIAFVEATAKEMTVAAHPSFAERVEALRGAARQTAAAGHAVL